MLVGETCICVHVFASVPFYFTNITATAAHFSENV